MKYAVIVAACVEGAWAGATLGAIGLVTGAIAGVFHRGDKWVPARPLVRASIGATAAGGVSVGFSRAF